MKFRDKLHCLCFMFVLVCIYCRLYKQTLVVGVLVDGIVCTALSTLPLDDTWQLK